MKHYTRRTFLLLPFILLVIKQANCDTITITTTDIDTKLNSKGSFNVLVTDHTGGPKTLRFTSQHNDIIRLTTSTLVVTGNGKYSIGFEAVGAGHSFLQVVNATDINIITPYVRVTVYKIKELDIVADIIGWLYFFAWSVSFYPQVYENWKRKSVVGLNFDFVMLNFIGFTLYSIFNLGMYCIPAIDEEYARRYPKGLNPVMLNDIFFSVHAMIITAVVIVQCIIYEQGNQRISVPATIIVGLFGGFLGISLLLSITQIIHWLDFLYYCSYVKLFITLIKYIPQAYQNYQRKSTAGWSIWNVLLDFAGGSLSMLQMIIIAYNYDDWASIFGDPTKFGLGLFSVIFDIFFIFQHYILYKDSAYEEEEEEEESSSRDS